MLLMALRKFLILRRLRSGRLEGRTVPIQPTKQRWPCRGFLQQLLPTVLIGGALAACAPQFFGGPPPGDLRGARQACNDAYPRRVGNYLPHARCVNAAVEAYAVPGSRNADLIRLQAELRETLSERIDRKRISVQIAERRMAEADRLVAQAESERAAGNEKAASRRIAAIEEMLR
jgi:hypothetical protein